MENTKAYGMRYYNNIGFIPNYMKREFYFHVIPLGREYFSFFSYRDVFGKIVYVWSELSLSEFGIEKVILKDRDENNISLDSMSFSFFAKKITRWKYELPFSKDIPQFLAKSKFRMTPHEEEMVRYITYLNEGREVA